MGYCYFAPHPIALEKNNKIVLLFCPAPNCTGKKEENCTAILPRTQLHWKKRRKLYCYFAPHPIALGKKKKIVLLFCPAPNCTGKKEENCTAILPRTQLHWEKRRK